MQQRNTFSRRPKFDRGYDLRDQLEEAQLRKRGAKQRDHVSLRQEVFLTVLGLALFVV